MGTRLREETEYKPKPMVDVGGRPILWHIMKYFSQFGHQEFVLCLGYKGNTIKEYFLNYEAMNNDFTMRLGSDHQIRYHHSHGEDGLSVTLADTGLDTMTGGRVRRVARHIDNDDFFLTYGDGLANVDLDRLLKFHKSHGKIATVTAFRPVSRFGVLELDSAGMVTKFAEKPQAEGWVSAGFMVFKRALFDYLPDDTCILEHEPMEKLAAAGQLAAYRHDGFFFAMDTYREYLHLNELWASGKAPWKTWDQP
jgi:glucose-1-phosphate cytidylyltransferase